MARRPTIHDVARQTGYSIATVSMVINNKQVSIPQDTRAKVLEAAKELGYRPNKIARSLITKRTMVLGLIIPDNTSLLFAAFSRAIEAAAHRAGYALIYGNTGNEVKRDLEYIEMFLDRQVDGIILLISTFYDQSDADLIMQAVYGAPVPVVALDRTVPGGNIRTVQLDHFRGGYLAAKHLLDLGHRRIVCSVSPGFITAREERVAGYRAALEEAGMDFDEDLLCEVTYEKGISGETLNRLLLQNATGLLAINDSMALEIFRQARRAGICIPKDLSVVGFDDVLFADMINPPLTTVRQPAEEIGSTAVETLLELIKNGQSGAAPADKPLLFEPRLIVRDSTCRLSWGNPNKLNS